MNAKASLTAGRTLSVRTQAGHTPVNARRDLQEIQRRNVKVKHCKLTSTFQLCIDIELIILYNTWIFLYIAINECKDKSSCHVNAICESKSGGGVKCTCKSGYEGNGKNNCKGVYIIQ